MEANEGPTELEQARAEVKELAERLAVLERVALTAASSPTPGQFEINRQPEGARIAYDGSAPGGEFQEKRVVDLIVRLVTEHVVRETERQLLQHLAPIRSRLDDLAKRLDQISGHPVVRGEQQGGDKS